MPMTFKKYFTPYEANQRLPLIKRVVEDILTQAREMKSLIATGLGSSDSDRYQKLLSRTDDFINELESLGCFYKDWNFEKGLVDFPAIIDGEEVLLCWASDEPDVRFYHRLNDGFAGRCPIPDHMRVNLEKISRD